MKSHAVSLHGQIIAGRQSSSWAKRMQLPWKLRCNAQNTYNNKCWAHSPLRAAACPFTRCRYRYCRTPPAHQCPRRQQQCVTEGTAMAPWNGPNNNNSKLGFVVPRNRLCSGMSLISAKYDAVM